MDMTGPDRVWIDDERPIGGKVHFFDHGGPFVVEYLRRDGETLTEVRDCLQACIAMIQHAIGPGRDVFIEQDAGRKLSE